MRKYIVVFAVGALLASCASNPNPANMDQLQKVEAGYGVLLSAAANYRELYNTNPCTKAKPLSTSNFCASRSVILILQDADKKVELAIKDAKDFIKNNPKVDAVVYISAAMSAVNDFKALEAQNGVK